MVILCLFRIIMALYWFLTVRFGLEYCNLIDYIYILTQSMSHWETKFAKTHVFKNKVFYWKLAILCHFLSITNYHWLLTAGFGNRMLYLIGIHQYRLKFDKKHVFFSWMDILCYLWGILTCMVCGKNIVI